MLLVKRDHGGDREAPISQSSGIAQPGTQLSGAGFVPGDCNNDLAGVIGLCRLLKKAPKAISHTEAQGSQRKDRLVVGKADNEEAGTSFWRLPPPAAAALWTLGMEGS
jgi:hypothetical protein